MHCNQESYLTLTPMLPYHSAPEPVDGGASYSTKRSSLSETSTIGSTSASTSTLPSPQNNKSFTPNQTYINNPYNYNVLGCGFPNPHEFAGMHPARCPTILIKVQTRMSVVECIIPTTAPMPAPGEYVVFEGDRGEDMGTVVPSEEVGNFPEIGRFYPSVLRQANAQDLTHYNTLATIEKERLDYANALSSIGNFGIEVVNVCVQYDLKKMTFWYRAVAKVGTAGFRQFVHEMYSVFKCRVWMINVEERKKRNPK